MTFVFVFIIKKLYAKITDYSTASDVQFAVLRTYALSN